MAQNQGPSIPTQLSSKNLGNVAGVVKGINPPKEADGVTEKHYVLWAKRLLTNPVTYELNYYDNASQKWKPLMGIDEEALFILRQQVFGTLNDPQIQEQLGTASLFEYVKNTKAVKLGMADSESVDNGFGSVTNGVSYLLTDENIMTFTLLDPEVTGDTNGDAVMLTLSDEIKRKLATIGLDEYENEFDKVRVHLSSRKRGEKYIKNAAGAINALPVSNYLKYSPRIMGYVPKLLINVYGLKFTEDRKTSYFIRMERYRKGEAGNMNFATGLTVPEQVGNFVSERMEGYKSYTDRGFLVDYNDFSEKTSVIAKTARPFEIQLQGASNYVDIGAEYYFRPHWMHYWNNGMDFSKSFPQKTGQQSFRGLAMEFDNSGVIQAKEIAKVESSVQWRKDMEQEVDARFDAGESVEMNGGIIPDNPNPAGVPYPIATRIQVQPMQVRLVKRIYQDNDKTILKDTIISPVMATFDILGILNVVPARNGEQLPSNEAMIRYRFNK